MLIHQDAEIDRSRVRRQAAGGARRPRGRDRRLRRAPSTSAASPGGRARSPGPRSPTATTSSAAARSRPSPGSTETLPPFAAARRGRLDRRLRDGRSRRGRSGTCASTSRSASMHGYDFDICMQARAAGKKVVTADLQVVHHHSLRLIDGRRELDPARYMRVAEKWDDAAPRQRLARPRLGVAGAAGRGRGLGGAADGRARGAAASRPLQGARGDARAASAGGSTAPLRAPAPPAQRARPSQTPADWSRRAGRCWSSAAPGCSATPLWARVLAALRRHRDGARRPAPRAAARVLDPERTLTGVRVEAPEARSSDALDRSGAGGRRQLHRRRQAASARPTTGRARAAPDALFPHQLPPPARLAGRAPDPGLHRLRLLRPAAAATREDDQPDPVDLYGRAKLAGEPAGAGALTVRTSMLGRELGTRSGLLEWFLAQRGPRSRLPAGDLQRPDDPGARPQLLADLVERQPDLDGIWHVGAEPISKLDLLRRSCATRSSSTSRSSPTTRRRRSTAAPRQPFRAATADRPPTGTTMIAELGGDDARGEEARC